MRGLHLDGTWTKVRSARSLCRLSVGLLILCASLHAQTLARHNWVGSGLNGELWWHSAVFYRIVPSTFQDSDGDGKGDLRGIAQRMTYLQTLGVDAVVLQSPFDESGFDDLQREASIHHIRLLLALRSSDEGLTLSARSWLTRGCAGIWLQVPAQRDATTTAAAIQVLRRLTDSFPGQRVLVEDTSADPAALALPGAQLVTRSILHDVGGETDALSLRVQLKAVDDVPPGSTPLVVLRERNERVAATVHQPELEKILASALFLYRGATAVDAGQEIAFDTATDARQNMQWTPSNVTRVSEPPAPAEATSPPPQRSENDYGPFVPYVAPAKKSVASTEADLDAQAGFSSVAIATFAAAEAHGNVAGEDAKPDSLLNFYRRLSQIHHETLSVRAGTTLLLHRDGDEVLAWVRKSPSNAGSFAMFVIANLGDTALSLTTVPEFPPHSRATALLPAISSAPSNLQVPQRTSAISVAPWSVAVLTSDR